MSTPTADLDPGSGPTVAGDDIMVRDLSPAEMPAASELLGAVWKRPTGSPMDVPMLVALAHGGNYVAGAFRGGALAGVCVGFFAAPPGDVLHSHIAGVSPDQSSRGVGWALKQHQRDWARARSIGSITWTFDPLVARNAYFNFHRLGVRTIKYIPDFYGDLVDGLNSGQGSDRLLVSWATAGSVPDTVDRLPPGKAAYALIATAPDGRPVKGAPVPSADGWCSVEVPTDVEGLRRTDPGLAQEWRHRLREVLPCLLDDGWQVVDVERAGRYILRRS